MKIVKVDELMDRCGTHIASESEMNEVVEATLVQGLLICVCAEFEVTLKKLIRERCSGVDDENVRNFAASCADETIRSASRDNLVGALKRFGDACKGEFNKRRNQDEDGAWDSYVSLVSERNKVAHGQGASVTFKDVRKYYDTGHVVLDWFKSALWAGE